MPIVSDIQYDFNEKKSPKSGKNTGSKCSLALCLAGYAPLLSVCTAVYSQTLFSYGDPYSGSMFSIEGGGGVL